MEHFGIVREPVEGNPTVAVYCRTASENADALRVQFHEIMEYLIDHGMTTFQPYFDNGYKGVNFSRPAFSRMMRDIEGGKVQIVAAVDVARITRNRDDFAVWFDTVERAGCRFLTLF